ncbi:MAG: polymer-forming cytoskeletal protein [Candidatus Omnitrophica bacterium]|nr:polymer-forming cytoskeletal protein [Candidatus Omnitrophota bacterium]MCF7888059.1 polymer-forming cytoskeletal protein [Candidatus Omnitrophota bacterium]
MARKKEKILDVDATMQGSLVFSDPVNLRINGEFDGNLTTKGSLTVGETASVKAQIKGENVIISGKVNGTIKADNVKLFSTAEVYGDIQAAKVSIEEGAIFDGRCHMSDNKVSLSEISDYLSVEKQKIMEWVETDKIPVEKEGKKLWFDRKKVDQWMATKT